MKVVLNIFTSLDFGGVESHAIMLQKGAKDTNYEHKYIAIECGGYVSSKLIEDYAHVEVLNLNPKIPSFSAIFSLYKLIKKIKPQVIHTRGAEASFHGVIAAYFAGIPVIVAEEVGIPTHSNLAKFVFKCCYLLCDKVIAISKSVQNYLTKSGEVSKDKVYLIYNPTEFFPITAAPENDCFTIGYIGRLEPVKNPIALVVAIKMIQDQGVNVKLEIVGDGSLKCDIENYVKENNLEGSINLHGFLSEPYQAIKNCDLYVQPSITEGFGIAVVEVMGAGIPVLASSVGGIPEFIDDKDNGWLLKRVDSQSIADSIQSILALTTEERLIIAKRGRNSVVNRFTIEKYITNLHDMYSSLLNEK